MKTVTKLTITKLSVLTCMFAATVAFAEGGTYGSPSTPTAATTAKETTMKQDLMMFKQEMAMKLEGAESEIMALKEKAKIKGSKVKQATIADLEKTKMKIKTDLDALDKSSESTWKNMKTKIATAMDDLNTKTQKAMRE